MTLCLFWVLSAGPCWAAQVAAEQPAVAKVELLQPGTLRKLSDLDFATLAATDAGTATINPNTGAMITTGGVMHLTGLPHPALFEDATRRRGATFIRIPPGPVTLTRDGGTETMTVSNWTISSNASPIGNGRYRIVANLEPFQFKVGGTLNVNVDQAAGTYVGDFEVDVEYP